MKKILLPILFLTLSISVNAQSIIDIQTIKDNPNEQLLVYANEDISILTNSISNFNSDFEPELTQILYNKYKMLTSNLSQDDILELTDSVKEKMSLLFGEELYQMISENEAVFNRITGTAYLANQQ